MTLVYETLKKGHPNHDVRVLPGRRTPGLCVWLGCRMALGKVYPFPHLSCFIVL